MELHFVCDCGMELVAKKAAAGKAFRCPSCGLRHLLNPDLTRTALNSSKKPQDQAPESSSASPTPRIISSKPQAPPVPSSFLIPSQVSKTQSSVTAIQNISPPDLTGAIPDQINTTTPRLPGGRMTDPASPQKATPAATILGILAAIIGALIGKYTVFHLLIPAVAAALAGAIAVKTAPPSRKPIIPTFAIQAGHFAWMLLGAVILHRFDLGLLDLAILAAGLTWLLARPSLPPILFLGAYQFLALIINAYFFFHATFDTPAHKALLVHLCLRIAAITTMITGLLQLRRSTAQSTLTAPGFPIIQ